MVEHTCALIPLMSRRSSKDRPVAEDRKLSEDDGRPGGRRRTSRTTSECRCVEVESRWWSSAGAAPALLPAIGAGAQAGGGGGRLAPDKPVTGVRTAAKGS